MGFFNYRSREWERFQRQQIERADFRCQSPGCGTRRHLHAHHMVPIWRAPHLAYEPRNIMVLCPVHHARVHGWAFVPRHWFTGDEPANEDQFEFDFSDERERPERQTRK